MASHLINLLYQAGKVEGGAVALGEVMVRLCCFLFFLQITVWTFLSEDSFLKTITKVLKQAAFIPVNVGT